MRRIGILAAVLVLFPAVAGAGGRARLSSGVLTPASRRAPEVVALSYLAGDAALSDGVPAQALSVRKARQLPGGALVEIEQRHHGLPVLGARAAVRLDSGGRVRWAHSTLRALGDLDVTPRLTAADALASAGARGAAVDRAHARLLIDALGDVAPRLAWEVVLPPDRARLEMWQVVVDALDGRVLARRNLVLRSSAHLASVYPENPISTPDLTEVTLESLPDGATKLTGPDIHAINCIDQGQCVDSGFGGYAHWCELGPVAATNGDGNFLDHVPPLDPLDPADLYAEVVAYYHTQKAYDHMRTIVSPEFTIDGSPVTAVANMRMPGEFCDGPGPKPDGSELAALDNAFFAPAGFGFIPGVDGASISMGQGMLADFAYDGDVIYHELGHGLVYTLAPDLGFMLPHEHGFDPTPGGLVEGLPDYISSSLTGDPLLGEYVGAEFDPDTGVIRNLDNQKTCPENIAGESHADGEIIAGSLWEVRAGLPAEDRPAMDAAVMLAIDAIGAETNFDAFQALVVAELDTALGATVSASASAAFVARGLVDCGDFVRDMGPDDVHDQLFLTNFVTSDRAPAAVQFRVDTGAGAEMLHIHATMYEGSDSTPVDLLIKTGGDPIVWTANNDADRLVELTPAMGVIDEDIPGPFVGVVHLQLASTSGQQGMNDISITGGVVAGADAGPEPGVDGGTGADEDDGGGCGCRSGGGSALGGVWLLALALCQVCQRRRKRA